MQRSAGIVVAKKGRAGFETWRCGGSGCGRTVPLSAFFPFKRRSKPECAPDQIIRLSVRLYRTKERCLAELRVPAEAFLHVVACRLPGPPHVHPNDRVQ